MTFFGLQLDNELEMAGHKPNKESRRISAARQKVLDRVLGQDDPNLARGRFADPAAMFG